MAQWVAKSFRGSIQRVRPQYGQDVRSTSLSTKPQTAHFWFTMIVLPSCPFSSRVPSSRPSSSRPRPLSRSRSFPFPAFRFVDRWLLPSDDGSSAEGSRSLLSPAFPAELGPSCGGAQVWVAGADDARPLSLAGGGFTKMGGHGAFAICLARSAGRGTGGALTSTSEERICICLCRPVSPSSSCTASCLRTLSRKFENRPR